MVAYGAGSIRRRERDGAPQNHFRILPWSRGERRRLTGMRDEIDFDFCCFFFCGGGAYGRFGSRRRERRSKNGGLRRWWRLAVKRETELSINKYNLFHEEVAYGGG